MMEKELSFLEMMKQLEKESSLFWRIKIIPYKVWAKVYIFFNISLPDLKYKIIEFLYGKLK